MNLSPSPTCTEGTSGPGGGVLNFKLGTDGLKLQPPSYKLNQMSKPLFFKGLFFFKPISTFYYVNWDA